MKKLLAALLFVFVFAQAAAASVAGNWTYSFTVKGIYGGEAAAITEQGGAIITAGTSGDQEILQSCNIGALGNVSIPTLDNYNYTYYYDKTYSINNLPYTMRDTFTISYDITIDGDPVTIELALKQTAQDTATGTVKITTKYNETSTGTVSANRQTITGTIAGRWDYTLTGTGSYLDDAVTLEEAGTVNLNGTDKTSYELLTGYSSSYAGTLAIPAKNYKYKYNGTAEKSLSPGIEYFPGKPVVVWYNTTIDGADATIYLYFLQSGVNSMSGKAMIKTASDTNFADITAVRYVPVPENSGGGGGCNAGLPLILLLMAIPFANKRKK